MGVSELIVMAMQALLNNGDEMLIPAPDYPLWTAAVTLAGGTPTHYLCDENNGWYPDLADIESKITPKTRGIVVINPNNPTGAVYPKHILEGLVALARLVAAVRGSEHQPARATGLLFAREAPGREQDAVRLAHHLLDRGVLEQLRPNGHPLAQVIEHLAVDGCSSAWRSAAQHHGRVDKLGLVGGEVVEAEVVDLDQAEV